MARYQVLYWRDIPAQVRVETDHDEVRLELDPRAQLRIDAAAMELGLHGTDEYLDHWHWGDPQDRPGAAQEVAETLKRELERALDPVE
jgi:hypothetical protein